MEQLAKWFDQTKPKKILDVATGAGNFIQMLRSMYTEYESIIGIDTLEYAINSAAKNFGDDERISFVQMDGMNMTYADDTFDLVILSNSLHHLSDQNALFQELHRVLQPGGYVLVSEMISNDLSEQQHSHLLIHHFAAEIDRYMGDTHGETYHEDEITTILTDMPFTIADTWKLSYERNTGNSDEEIAWLKNTLDRIVNRVEDETDKQQFQAKADSIKTYIDQHGFDAATTMIVVMKK